MKPNSQKGIFTGILFFLLLLFILSSGYIIPGRDPDIGAFQLTLIIVCATAMLMAFDFAMLWPRHSFLTWRDWAVSMIGLMAGVVLLNILNILESLGVFLSSGLFMKYVGGLVILSGLYWRFHLQANAILKSIGHTIRRDLVPSIFQLLEMQLQHLTQLKANNLLLAAMLIFGFELLLFKTYYTVSYQPYFARAYDQTVFLQAEYATFYSIRDYGLWNTIEQLLRLQPSFFKGLIVPNLGVVFMFLFGPNRFSAALVNFFFFCLGQMFLFFYFRKRINISAGLVAIGLFYLSLTHYYWAGGLNDLRLDYAGMVVFGIAFVCLADLLERPSLKHFLRASALLAIAFATRSITGVYLIATITFINVFLFMAGRLKGSKQTDNSQSRYFGYLLLASVTIFVIVFVLVGTASIGYYSHLFQGADRSIRAAEFSVLTVWDNLLYYPRSFIEHFQYYGYVLISIGLLKLMKLILFKGQPIYQNGLDRFRSTSYSVLFGLAVLAVWIILLAYAQTPLVIGVLTIPIVFILTTLLGLGSAWMSDTAKLIISGIVFVFGLLFYAENMITPRYLSSTAFVEAENMNSLYGDIAGILPHDRIQLTLFWMVPHDATNTPSFNVYLYEHDRKYDLPVASLGPGFYSTTGDEIIKQIEASDVIVAPIYFPAAGVTEYPYLRSLRQSEGLWRKTLDKEFVLTGMYNISSWSLGLYVRPCLILDFHAPEATEDLASPLFWLGDYPSEVHIESFARQPLTATFTATASLGPSNTNTSKGSLRYEINGAHQEYMLSEVDGWDLTIQMTLQPGKNILFLEATDYATINADGNTRHLLLKIQNMNISCRKP